MDAKSSDVASFDANLHHRVQISNDALVAVARGNARLRLSDALFGLVAALSFVSLLLEPRYPALNALSAALAVQSIFAARTKRRLDALAELSARSVAKTLSARV